MENIQNLEIEKKNLISRYVFQYIPYIPRKKCFQKKWKLFKNIKKKFREIEVNVYVCCKINFHTYTQTHAVAFFGSDQNNNPKNVINDGLVYVSFPTSV